MKKPYLYLLLFIFHINYWSQSQSQTQNDFNDLMLGILTSDFSLEQAANCQHQKYGLKNLYFVDQSEDRRTPNLKVQCKNFQTMANVIQTLALKLKTHFKTHLQLKNLNFVLVDILKNAIFNSYYTAIVVPLKYDLGNVNESFKHPKFVLPMLVHEYAHYILHSNYKVFDFNKRSNASLDFYFDAIHELLSDVLVVVDTNDPKIMYDSMFSTNLLQYPNGRRSDDIFVEDRVSSKNDSKYNKYLLAARNFEDRKNDLDYLLAKMKSRDKIILDGYFYHPHSLLAPVRYFLWNYVISNPELKQKLGGSAGMTKFIFDEAAKFYASLSKKRLPNSTSPIKSFEWINREMIKWLKNSLK